MKLSSLLVAALLSMCALSACGDGPPASLLNDGGNVPTPDASGDATVDAGPPAPGCDSGPNMACTCTDGRTGLRYCNAALGTYSECSCGAAPSGGMRCKAGYYTGTFQGDWRPGAFDLGGGLTLVTADIEASGTVDKPGLALTLKEKSTQAGEFSFYEVENGCVTGTATAGGLDSHPFVATLTGTLDCATGEFEGIMDGRYSLFDLGELSVWEFSGPLTASFDTESSSLDEGTWDLREKQTRPDEDPGAGGEGTWNAAWQSDDSPALPPECEALLNGEFDADAGVPQSDSDAGADASI